MGIFKNFSRLISVFGVVMLFAVSGRGGAFSITAPSPVTEATGAYMRFTITLTAYPSNGCSKNSSYTVNFATTAGGTATAGADFTTTSQLITISPTDNQSNGVCGSATVDVPIFNDTLSESDETVAVTLTSPSANATIEAGLASAAGTIIDDDTTLSIAINDASIAEADTNAIVNITLSQPSPTGGITLNYSTANGTATSSADYTGVTTPLSVTIPEGATTYSLSIPIHNDTEVEWAEYFTINISGASVGTIIDNQGQVMIFDDDSAAACSSYVGLITINEYQNNPNYFDASRHKIMGNYVEIKYIDALVKQHIDDNWTVSVYSNQMQTIPWSGRDQGCTDPYYEVFQYGSNVMGASGYVVLKDQNGNEVDLLNINNSNAYSQNCHSFVWDTDFPSSMPQNKEIFRDPDGTGDWSDLGLGANSEGSRCLYIPSNGLDLVYTQFDAIDDDEVLPTLISSDADVPLKTKITNQPFSIKILSLETDLAGSIGTLKPISQTIKVYLANGNGGALLDPTGYLVNFNGQSNVTLSNLSYPKAAKTARIWFEYCQDSTGIVHNWDECYGGANNDWRRHSFSRDAFAIRPSSFALDTNVTGVLKAGETVQAHYKALDFINQNTVDYNETVGMSFDVNLTERNPLCKTGTFSPNVTWGWSFADGYNGMNTAYNEVGIIDINVTERGKTLQNRFAGVDYDDTPEANLTIADGISGLSFIPHHFALDANVTNGGNGFTYLSNDLTMSADLNLSITAQALGNTTTQNYNTLCYAKSTNYWITSQLTPATITPVGALSKLLYRETRNLGLIYDKNISSGTDFNLSAVDKAVFATDNNGTAKLNFNLNFDRNQTLLVNPFDLNVTKIDMNDTDNIEGNATYTNKQVYYLYGRLIPRDVRIFGDGSTFSANGWYEVYNAPDINGTGLAASQNEAMWYTNRLHNDLSDGDGNVTVVIVGTNPTNTTPNLIGGIESYGFTNYPLGSYKAHIKTAPWLWYGIIALPYHDPVNATNLDCLTHPCFNINVVPPKGATGSAKTSTEAEKKANKSTSTPAGGSLIYDYAPAIR